MLEERQQECDNYQKELEELKEEKSALDQSLTELDSEHEIVVGQLIQQRDDLRHANTALSEQVTTI